MGILIAERDTLRRDLQECITKNIYSEQLIKTKDKEREELLGMYQLAVRQHKEAEVELQKERAELQNQL